MTIQQQINHGARHTYSLLSHSANFILLHPQCYSLKQQTTE